MNATMTDDRSQDGPRGFLEDKLDPDVRAPQKAAYYLGLIPYEATTTYGKGTRWAPEAVVDASGHMELYDETLGIDASKHGIKTLRPNISDLDSITRFARALRSERPKNLLGFIGGEHSITPALIEGCCDSEIGIVWIDAHADLRESYLGRKDNHACAGFNSAQFGPIVQIGVRTLAMEEALYLRSSDRVRSFGKWTSEARRALSDLPEDIYLTVDADGFAPEVVRAVGTPEPGGLYWDDVVDIVDTIFRGKNVVAFDTVELCPAEHDVASTFTIAKLVYKIITCHAYYNLKNE
jgi:agmatinase